MRRRKLFTLAAGASAGLFCATLALSFISDDQKRPLLHWRDRETGTSIQLYSLKGSITFESDRATRRIPLGPDELIGPAFDGPAWDHFGVHYHSSPLEVSHPNN